MHVVYYFLSENLFTDGGPEWGDTITGLINPESLSWDFHHYGCPESVRVFPETQVCPW